MNTTTSTSTTSRRADVEHTCACVLAHLSDNDLSLALGLLGWFAMLSDQGKAAAVDSLEDIVLAESYQGGGVQA